MAHITYGKPRSSDVRDAQEPLRFVVACDIFFHMDSFCEAFMTFLHYLDFQWRERNIPGFIKITLICVLNSYVFGTT